MKTKRHCIIPVVLGVILFFSSPLLYAEITRGPFLQPTDDMETSVGVAWRTLNGGSSTISYGISDVNENTSTVEPVEDIEEGVTVYKYYIQLGGLTPGAIYKYKVEGDGDVTPVYEFKTSPPDGQFKLLVGSDWHMGSGGSREIYTHFFDIYEDMLTFDPDVLFLTGDIAETDRWPDELAGPYGVMFDTCRELFATAIVVPIPGNHERAQDPNLDFYVEQFYLPENGPEDEEERTYSFDYGGAHFVVMKGYINRDWLDADLAQARERGSDFIFTGRHFPTSLGGLDHRLGNDLYDIYDVNIQFNGHNHAHQRSFPVVINHDPLGHGQWFKWNKGIVFTADISHYGANIDGTIYHQIRSAHYQKESPRTNLYICSATDPDVVRPVGYTEVTLNNRVATVESYGYKKAGSPVHAVDRTLEDSYEIDKNDTSEPPTPMVSNVTITEITSHRAVTEWETDIPARGQVEFGTSPGDYPYLNMRDEQNQVFTTSHRAALQCLTPGTTYYYRVKSWRAGKEGTSEGSFTTPSEIQEGEVVAEFDFGPIDYAPDGTRISPAPFDTRTRRGWLITEYAKYPGSRNNAITPVPVDATDTFCFRENKSSPVNWRTELPNGEYDLEIAVGKSLYKFGDIRIDFENGQATFEAEMPGGSRYERANALKIWSTPITIEDGFLDIEMGYGDSAYLLSTIINRLRIWTRGHYPPGYTPDVTPPSQITDFSVSDVGENAVTLTWTAPGDDGDSGQATSYDIRHHPFSSIDTYWFISATQVLDEPVPETSGTTQSHTVTELIRNRTYYFAIRALDDTGNISTLSNIVVIRNSSPPLSLRVSLLAEPTSGIAPLDEITLTATVEGTAEGNINYYFYSNYPGGGLEIGSPDAQFEDVAETTKTVTIPCNYSNPRTYYPKVIVQRSGLAAENRVSIVVSPPSGLEGDVNGDGKVDIRDLLIVARAFGSVPGGSAWNPDADLVTDGKIDIRDLLVVARNFGRS